MPMLQHYAWGKGVGSTIARTRMTAIISVRSRRGVGAFMLIGLMWIFISDANSAGPVAGDIYINFGAGIFGPKFDVNLQAGQRDLDGPASALDIDLTISLPLVGDIQVVLPLTSSSTDSYQISPENRSMVSLGGVVGYQFTQHWGAELGLDLGLPEIDIQRLYILRDVIPGNAETINVEVMPPSLLPITMSAVYTFMPASRISPYVGFGPMIALLDNRRAQSPASDVLVLDGGVELGFAAHGGVKLDFGGGWYGYFDMKYGRIESPDIDDKTGIKVDVDNFEVRHMRFGIGFGI